MKGLRALSGRQRYVYVTPLQSDGRTIGALAVLLDASPLEAAEAGLWQYNAVRFFFLAFGLSVITAIVVRMTVTRPMSAIAEWAKTLRAGRPTPLPDLSDPKLFGPLAHEVTGLARSLYRARAGAEQEAALRIRGEAIWTEERLKQFARARLSEQLLPAEERRRRMNHMHQLVREQNIYRWAGLLLGELSQVRREATEIRRPEMYAGASGT